MRIIWMLVLSLMKRTRPSPSSAWAPPECRLKGSLFDPQLFVAHGHCAGPPSGAFQLLMTCVNEPGIYNGEEGSCVGGPEMPVPVLGSAQRYGASIPPPNVPGVLSANANNWVVSNPGPPPINNCDST